MGVISMSPMSSFRGVYGEGQPCRILSAVPITRITLMGVRYVAVAIVYRSFWRLILEDAGLATAILFLVK
jgi:hypothetical protein